MPPGIATAQYKTMMARREIPLLFGRHLMRFILGMIVGAALILGSAYVHDKNWVRFGPSQAFVNWDTVIGMMGR